MSLISADCFLFLKYLFICFLRNSINNEVTDKQDLTGPESAAGSLCMSVCIIKFL